MIVGDLLRTLRERKKLSQGDIEKRTGLLRCYISRVENGHTVPNLETLEKFASALEVPLYQLFYDGNKPPQALHLPKYKAAKETREDRSFVVKFSRLLGRMADEDRRTLLFMAQKMAHK